MTLPTGFSRLLPNRQADTDPRLHPALGIAARYWAVIVAATLVGAAAGYGLSQLATQEYSARSVLYFSIGSGVSGSDLNQGASYAQGQMLSFVELAETEHVLAPVVDDLGLDFTPAQLAEALEVSTPSGTSVITVAARATDPEQAAALANAAARSLVEVVQEVAPRDPDGRATVTVRTVDRAETPTVPVSPNTRVNTVAGALLGLALCVLVILAIRRLDTRVRGTEQLAAAGALPLLGSIVRSDGTALAPSDPAAEHYRRLAATLDAVLVERPSSGTKQVRKPRTFVVTSAVEDGGAVTVAANLAAAMAEAGSRVSLVAATDADLPDAPANVEIAGLDLLHSIPSPPNTDTVIVAAPGPAASSGALVLGRAADGVVLVVDTGTVHVGELRDAVTALETAGARVVGTALTTNPPRVRAERERHASANPLPVLENKQA